MDETENIRRTLQSALNAEADGRAETEKKYGQCWDIQELSAEFEVLGFMAPYVVVRRLSDGKRGSLMFQHHPRLYFAWKAD